MRFTERKDFLTDPAIFKRKDSITALKIYAESVKKYSANPPPKFFEVDRNESQFDALWHATINDREAYTREIGIPAINKFIKPDWKLTRMGVTPQRRDDFILAYNILSEVDYFPLRGDRVYWNGYRYIILKVVIDPEAYWQQTNQWLGLRVECIVPPEGDSRPTPTDVSTRIPAEISTAAPWENFIPPSK
jgi:hypothetical protein